jgi:hypothetical protein
MFANLAFDPFDIENQFLNLWTVTILPCKEHNVIAKVRLDGESRHVLAG